MSASPALPSSLGLFHRVEALLAQLRPAFRRQATFEWFLLLCWSLLLRPDGRGVTSCLDALGLGAQAYHQALHFFRSKAFSNEALVERWHELVSGLPFVKRLSGRPVYVADGIKVAKEGRRMPGVKRLHQESGNTTKPPYINGHYFTALGLLLGADKALFHCPLVHEIHDGLEGTPETDPSIVERTAMLIGTVVPKGGIVVLDAFFAAASLLSAATQKGIDVITRVRLNTVAYKPLPPPPEKRGRGRPRVWGDKVALVDLFDDPDGWKTDRLCLYDEIRDTAWKVVDLYWHDATTPVRFVLARSTDGLRAIFLSTCRSLTGPEIVSAYALRFKIEVGFRTLHQVLFAFDYHFWLKPLEKATRVPRNLDLAACSVRLRACILAKVRAYERFVNLAGIALGLLQILALEQSSAILSLFPRYFRTLPAHGLPSEQVVRLTLQHHAPPFLDGTTSNLLLHKILSPLRAREAAAARRVA